MNCCGGKDKDRDHNGTSGSSSGGFGLSWVAIVALLLIAGLVVSLLLR